MTNETLGRFGHHPNPAIDFCIEVEELESIAENARLGLTGYGHEEDCAGVERRIEAALDFRVGGDPGCVDAKAGLRSLASEYGFTTAGVVAYAGQPLARQQP